MSDIHIAPPVKTRRHIKNAISLRGMSEQVKKADGINAKIAVFLTNIVGSMWCAYAFAILALLGLRPALKPGGEGLIAWIAQTFLQLVLLSVIIVGQNVLAAAADKRSEATYKDADAVLHEAVKIQEHLLAQDDVLTTLAGKMANVEARIAP